MGITARQRGFVIILSMIFLAVFGALAVCMATVSATNVQVAENQRDVNRARACAESGLEVMRYWLGEVSISGSTATDERLAGIGTALGDVLEENGVDNLVPTISESGISIAEVVLDADQDESFFAVITSLDDETLQVEVTGNHGSVSRTVGMECVLGSTRSSIFDYGVATRGPLSLKGSVSLRGVNTPSEADTYIESLEEAVALSIQNGQIEGDVSIANSSATVDLQGGHAAIGGEEGEDAVNNHITFGVTVLDWPEPNPSLFESYATNTLSGSGKITGDQTLANVRIPARTDPKFTGNVTINGVLFVEVPNEVTFGGNVTITGIIVGDGDWTDNSGENVLDFGGSVDCNPVTDLPDEASYAGLHEETGTFVLAPGFAVEFGGSFGVVSGCIVANGVNFSGSAGGTINGSVMNYSDEEMSVDGSSDISFNRSDADSLPAGFAGNLTLTFQTSTYSESTL